VIREHRARADILGKPPQEYRLARQPTGNGVIARQRQDPLLLARSRELRRAATDTEQRAWALLRGRRVLGLRFRRQQVIGPFIVDFYCAQLRLALELDGPIHEERGRAVRDLQRDGHLAAKGVQILRIRNEALTADLLDALLRPFVTPSPGGRGGRGVRGERNPEGEMAGGVRSERPPPSFRHPLSRREGGRGVRSERNPEGEKAWG